MGSESLSPIFFVCVLACASGVNDEGLSEIFVMAPEVISEAVSRAIRRPSEAYPHACGGTISHRPHRVRYL